MNLYAVVDVVAGKIIDVGLGDSDGAFVRNNLPIITRTKPIQDLQIRCLCQIDDDFYGEPFVNPLGNFEGTNVPLDSYHFDEVTAEHLTKTEAVQQIEQWRKARELQLQKMSAEIEKIKAETPRE